MKIEIKEVDECEDCGGLHFKIECPHCNKEIGISVKEEDKK